MNWIFRTAGVVYFGAAILLAFAHSPDVYTSLAFAAVCFLAAIAAQDDR